MGDDLQLRSDPFLLLEEMERERKTLYEYNCKHPKELIRFGSESEHGGADDGLQAPPPARVQGEESDTDGKAMPKRKQSIGGGEAVVLKSYPIVPGSPWHKEHVEVLGKLIPNFEEYATTRKPGPAVFDLLLWSICCGAPDLSQALFRHCRSPIRVAFFAQHFSQNLETRSQVGEKSRLSELQRLFENASHGVLENVLHPLTRRQILLMFRPRRSGKGAGSLFGQSLVLVVVLT